MSKGLVIQRCRGRGRVLQLAILLWWIACGDLTERLAAPLTSSFSFVYRKNAENMYYFSELALTLNAPESGTAPTDSRLRPDQRLMENGRWDEANAEKQRLEEKQRIARKKREAEAVKASEDGKSYIICTCNFETCSKTFALYVFLCFSWGPRQQTPQIRNSYGSCNLKHLEGQRFPQGL